MKKRICSFIMVLAMMLTMLPITVQAESNSPMLAYRLAGYNSAEGAYFEDKSFSLQMSYDSAPSEIGTAIIPYYIDAGGNENKLVASDVRSSNSSVVQIQVDPSNAEVTLLKIVGFGNATIDFSTGGKTYSLPVSGELPSVGCYSAATASESSYITEFVVTGEDSDVFYIAGHNCTLDNVALEAGSGDFADIVLSEDKTYAAVTINGDFESKWYTFQGKMHRPDGTYDFSTRIYLKDGRPTLKFYYTSMSNNQLTPSGSLRDQLSIANGMNYTVLPYLVTGEGQQLIKADELQSSNESIVKISSLSTYPDGVVLNAVGFGNAEISYVRGEKRYSFKVTVGLPNVGFYTTTTASESSYITEFNVTDAGPNVFYMIAKNGTLDNVSLLSGLADIATVTVSDDKTYAAITVTGTPKNASYMYTVQGQLTQSNGSTATARASIKLHNAKSTFKFDNIKYNSDGTVSPNGSPYDKMALTVGMINDIFAVFGAQDSYVTLSAEQLESSDESIVKISHSTRYSDAVVIEAVSLGTATISYVDDNGNTHSCEVHVGLPAVGYYITPSVSEGSYITKFTVTDDGPNVFYLVGHGYTIDNLVLNNGLSDIATVVLSDDKSYATITVHGTPDAHSYTINYNMTSIYGNTYSSGSAIQLVNGKASLQWEYVMWDESGVPSPSGYPQSRMNVASGSILSVYPYFVKNGIKEPVAAGNLKASNENIVKVLADEEYADIVKVEICGFGSAAITYTHSDGKTYEIPITALLPAVGIYTTATASENTYITEYSVTDEGPNVIYLATNSCTIENVVLEDELSEIATVTLSDDKTYATIEITGTPQDKEYEIHAAVESGGLGWVKDLIIRLKNEKVIPAPSPTPEVEVKVEENIPTVDASKPVENVTVGVDKEAADTVLEDTVKEIISAIINTPAENVGALKDKVSEEVVSAIQSALESGAALQVTTAVKVDALDKNTVVDEEIKADITAIEKLIADGNEGNVSVDMKDAKVLQLLDIKVTVTAKVNNVDAATGNVSVLDEPVVFTVAIPEAMKNEIKNAPEGYERQIYIIYVHDGVVKTIPAKQNADGTVSFAAQEFSTYALVYKDVPKTEQTPVPEPEQTPVPASSSPVSPATGDTAQVAWYMLLCVLSAVVLGMLSLKGKIQK